METKRRWTQELLAAQTRGKRIVCSIAPYWGERVVYSPRYLYDREPWVVARRDVPYRFTGRECHAV